MAENRVGQQLGNYILTRRLGEGGFAEVYLGTHIYLKTEAALKILHTRLAQTDMEEFVSEARTIARLRHPHIVRVLEFGVDSGMPFLVLDYAPNGTLRERHPKESRLAPAVVLSYLKPITSALQYAHEQELVHRDVKPENMLIGEHHEVLLSDFGIATVAQSSRYQGAQEVAGTAAYMAPEQIRGKPRFASDQYSLGIVVYEWLTGERPFRGSFTEIAAQHVMTPPVRLREKLPTIPPAIEETVLIALAKNAKERFATIQAFANAFEQACPNTNALGTPLAQSAIFLPPLVSKQPPTIDARSPQMWVKASPPITETALAGYGEVSDPSTPLDTSEAFTPASARSETRSKASFSPPYSFYDSFFYATGYPKPGRKLVISVISIIAIILIIGVWSTIQGQASPAAFQQQITTGTHITSIQVGTAMSNESSLQDQTDTFHPGDQSCMLISVSTGGVTGGPIAAILYQGSNTFFSGPIVNGLFPSIRMPLNICSNLGDVGIYKWVATYNGSAEASITFQVVAK